MISSAQTVDGEKAEEGHRQNHPNASSLAPSLLLIKLGGESRKGKSLGREDMIKHSIWGIRKMTSLTSYLIRELEQAVLSLKVDVLICKVEK